MKKNTLSKLFTTKNSRSLKNKLKVSCSVLMLILTGQVKAQETITLYDGVLFYGGYTPLLADEDLYETIPSDVLRFSNSLYTRKITDAELDLIGNTLEMDVTIEAACDNYDRLGHVFLAFTPKEASTYVSADVPRVEIGRFITPFMNKNVSPNNVSYHYKADNISEILSDATVRAQYDIWVELQVFGTTGAGQTQVAGCADHLDTFRATLSLTTNNDSGIVYEDDMFFMPLIARQNLNNYNATDVPGETTKIINFSLATQQENLKLYLITSKHGANEGGEEYVRRRHYVYLDNTLIYQYIPGGKDCEPYRQYNTQGNGIYGSSAKPLRGWIYWNNWCPGDAIPTLEVNLGTLPAGDHTIKIDVPDAEFVDAQGQIPLSAYIQNRESGDNSMCTMPANFTAQAISDNEIMVNWDEIGNAEEWEVLYGKIYNSNGQTTYAILGEEDYLEVTGGESEGIATENVQANTVYQVFVRSKCGNNANSLWSEPRYVQTQQLSVADNELVSFTYYPNPVIDNLFLSSQDDEITAIAMYDIQGREVLSENITGNDAVINMINFPTGIYLLKVNISGKSQTYKVEKK
ncbi:T9SS type A sorting domain-containing protein [Flavobacterium alkalisoli]|uniref:T9SS type A sorting domain-containing protein n=1 Tax=Flavobacterium alkalisoli TaxID=2602769 RepID=A0A5B9G1C6_9FLAO|nr:peptide-N-glycosidase F-related protein [Flavobacterium alkalisoli]QEE50827.1 T9SS type A sorting domain-containing protein [Flavobacterium alkalisoli]